MYLWNVNFNFRYKKFQWNALGFKKRTQDYKLQFNKEFGLRVQTSFSYYEFWSQLRMNFICKLLLKCGSRFFFNAVRFRIGKQNFKSYILQMVNVPNLKNADARIDKGSWWAFSDCSMLPSSSWNGLRFINHVGDCSLRK